MKIIGYLYNMIFEIGGFNEGFFLYFYCKYFWFYVKYGIFFG